ncbi:MAG: formate dehydrogenase subunit gamma [Thermodesulfobacteriota bacterium]
MSKTMLRRHTRAGIFMHWFNAASWLFLLATGLGLIDNPELRPFGPGYPGALRAMFGGGANLLMAHWLAALAWLAVWFGFIALYATRHVLPFLRQIAAISPARDLEWMAKKQVQMMVGYKLMARLVRPLGWDGKLPEQEYYNAGQKLAAQGIIAGALVLVGTGLAMLASKYVLGPGWETLVQWSITIHYLAALFTTVLLLVHVYMAAISSEERPAFISMFTGAVPAEYARRHHKLWHDQAIREDA